MSMIKCKDCGKEISIRSKQCIHCGSDKPFNGYRFKRKELKEMGLNSYSDFSNFIDRGGKIGSPLWGKLFKALAWSVFAYFIIATIVDDVEQTERIYNAYQEQTKG